VTATGNLSRAVVAEMWKLVEWPDYDRLVGALANLGYEISDQTVGNILQRHAVPSAPQRKHTTTWAAFIRTHLGAAGGDRLLHGGGAHAARAACPIRCVSAGADTQASF